MAEQAPDFGRIRGNIQKMLSQNAPETDIDAYLSSEGVTADALRAAKPQKVYSGAILPFSKDDAGKVSFDSDAGIVGSIKRTLMLPGEVASGKVKLPSSGAVPGSVPFGDPESGGLRVAEAAMVATPMVPRAGPFVGAAAPKPTQKELFGAAEKGYDAARQLPLDINPAGVKVWAEGVGAALERDGINGELAPKTFSTLQRLLSPPEGSVVTVNNLETLRRTLGHAAADFSNPTEQKAAKTALQSLQKYMGDVPASDVLAGDPRRVAEVLRDATGNYAAAKRSQGVTDLLESADLRASAANSGQNIGNTIRQSARRMLENDAAGYNPAEVAQAERLIGGTVPGNAARIAGNALGGGGGLGAIAAAGVGGAATAPFYGVGAAAPLVGYGLKKASDASVQRQARLLDELLRSRSPLAAELEARAANAPGQLPPDVLARMLLSVRPDQQQ